MRRRQPPRGVVLGVVGLAACLIGGAAGAQVPPPPEGAPTTPALERLLDHGGTVERVAHGFSFADGPVWHPDGYLLFTDAPRGLILRWHGETEVTVEASDSGGATSLLLDDGRRLAAERDRNQVTATTPGGAPQVLADSIDARPMRAPTDLARGRRGSVYVAAAGPPAAIVRLDEGGATAVARDVERPAGLVVSPDGGTLYVSDAATSTIRAYPVADDGTLGEGRLLTSVQPWKRGVRGTPDGLAVDAQGHLFLAGPGGVWVLAANGGRLGVIATPETPTACVFGDADRRTLYITARRGVYKVRLTVAGAR